MAELRSSSDLGLSDENLKEACKNVENYINQLLELKDIFNFYRVRQFFEFNKIGITSEKEDIKESIHKESETLSIDMNTEYFDDK